MAVKLLAINDVYNIREAKYIVDEENEKNLIPEEDKVQGTRVLVIKGSKEYRMDSNKNWVLIKGEGGGDSSLPEVSSTDNGKVLGVVNGEWDKMTAPGDGSGDAFLFEATITYDDLQDPHISTDLNLHDLFDAIEDGKTVFIRCIDTAFVRATDIPLYYYNIDEYDDGQKYINATFSATNAHLFSKAAAFDGYIIDLSGYAYPNDDPETPWLDITYSKSEETTAFVPGRVCRIAMNTATFTASTTFSPDMPYQDARTAASNTSLSIILKSSLGTFQASHVKVDNDARCIYFEVLEPCTTLITATNYYWSVHQLKWMSTGITLVGSKTVALPILPDVTSSDNGKVLGVVNGVWNKMAVPGGLPVVTPSDYDKILTVNSSGAWDIGEKDYFVIDGWYNGVNGFDEIVGQADELHSTPSDTKIIDAILNYKDMLLFMHTGHAQPYYDTVEVLQCIGFGWETYTRNGEVYKQGWAQFQNIHDTIESAHDMYLHRHDVTFYFDTYYTNDPGSWEYLYDQNEYQLLPSTTSSDNGKVLGVVDGAWDKITAPSGLPSVTSSDNGKVLGVSGGAWNKVSGLPSVGDNDNGKFLSVIDNAWAKKDPLYQVDLGSDSVGFTYESGSGNYAEGNPTFLMVDYPFPDTITVEYDEVRYTLPRTSESTYEYPACYGDDTYTYAPFYISIDADTTWHFLAPISEVGTGHSISCTLTDFAIATDEFKAAVKACGATGYNVFSPLTVIAQSQSVTTTSDGTHNIGDIITTITVDAPPKYIQITSPGYIVYSYGIYSEEGYQGIYYDDSEHDFEILYDMNESSWKLITPLAGTYTVEIACEIKTSVQPSEDFKEAAKNSFSIHNYTVVYDDGTTATLKNVEVV